MSLEIRLIGEDLVEHEMARNLAVLLEEVGEIFGVASDQCDEWQRGNAQLGLFPGLRPHLVERWFAEITRKRIRRGTFRSLPDLIRAIEEYVTHHNRHAEPFIWTAAATTILRKVRHCKEALETAHWNTRCNQGWAPHSLFGAQGIHGQHETGAQGGHQGRDQRRTPERHDGCQGHNGIVWIHAVQLAAQEPPYG